MTPRAPASEREAALESLRAYISDHTSGDDRESLHTSLDLLAAHPTPPPPLPDEDLPGYRAPFTGPLGSRGDPSVDLRPTPPLPLDVEALYEAMWNASSFNPASQYVDVKRVEVREFTETVAAEYARLLPAATPSPDAGEPQGDQPDQITVQGHMFVHVAACPCPRIQGEVARLAAQKGSTDDDQ
jgi:hypothetical protein